MSSSDLVYFFFELSNQIKLYHWQTSIYARHVASDQLFLGLLPLIDQFMETYQGKKGLRVSLPPSTNNQDRYKLDVTVYQFDDAQMVKYLTERVKFLQDKLPGQYIRSSDTDLLNIRDEMVGLINKTLYLFSFE